MHFRLFIKLNEVGFPGLRSQSLFTMVNQPFHLAASNEYFSQRRINNYSLCERTVYGSTTITYASFRYPDKLLLHKDSDFPPSTFSSSE